MQYYIKVYGRYHVNNLVHGHPKTSLLKENAKVYKDHSKAEIAAKKIYGTQMIFEITNL